MNALRIECLGDNALLLRFGDAIDATINRRVHSCAAALRAQAPDWLTDLTIAYASLALHVDVARIGGADSFNASDPLGTAQAWRLETRPVRKSERVWRG